MLDYNTMTKGQRLWMLYLLILFAIGAAFTPYTRFFLGLLLGSAVSSYSLWLLQRKVYDFGKAVSEKRSPLGLGTLTRIVTSVLAVVIAQRFEENIHLYAVIIGLASSYVVILVDSFVRSLKETRKQD